MMIEKVPVLLQIRFFEHVGEASANGGNLGFNVVCFEITLKDIQNNLDA